MTQADCNRAGPVVRETTNVTCLAQASATRATSHLGLCSPFPTDLAIFESPSLTLPGSYSKPFHRSPWPT